MPTTEQILENVVRLVGVIEKVALQEVHDLPILELAKWVIFAQPDPLAEKRIAVWKS